MLSIFSGQLWKDNQPAPFLIFLLEYFPTTTTFLYLRESKCFRAIFTIISQWCVILQLRCSKKKSFSGWIDTSISLVSCFRIQYHVEIMKDVVVNKEPQMLLIYLIIMLIPLQNFLSPRTFWIVSMGSLLNKAAIIKSEVSYHLNEIRSGFAFRCE